MLNGLELAATVNDSERVVLGVASGTLGREGLVEWVRDHVVPLRPSGKT